MGKAKGKKVYEAKMPSKPIPGTAMALLVSLGYLVVMVAMICLFVFLAKSNMTAVKISGLVTVVTSAFLIAASRVFVWEISPKIEITSTACWYRYKVSGATVLGENKIQLFSVASAVMQKSGAIKVEGDMDLYDGKTPRRLKTAVLKGNFSEYGDLVESLLNINFPRAIEDDDDDYAEIDEKELLNAESRLSKN